MKIGYFLLFLAALANPLAAADGIQMRGGLPNVKYALENGKPLRVTYLGTENTLDLRVGGQTKSYHAILGKRDHVHANDRGKQTLGHILAAYSAPKAKPEISLLKLAQVNPFQLRIVGLVGGD